MKKYFYLLLIPLCMGLAACSKDDEKTTEQTNVIEEKDISPLIGTWERVIKNSNNYGSGWWEQINTETYTFKDDGTYYYSDIADYNENGNTDSKTMEEEKGIYTYDSTTRTLSIIPDDNRALSFIVLTLADNILTLMGEDGGKRTFSKKN